ncbi:MAG: galactose ABC transporter substrate-binding protein [bacterium]|nr:galactose ABC transporter substrate-binding protein [bacterium]
MRVSRKVKAMALVSCMALSLTACGGGQNSTSAAEENNTTTSSAQTTENTSAATQGEDTQKALEGEVAVFYYTYGDTYISSVRSALDNALSAAGIQYQDYDSNNSQTTQTEQVTTAIAKGSTLLVVNLVDSGSDDAAKNIIEQASAQNIPVIFFNRSVSEEAVSSYDKCVFVGTDYEMAGHMQGEMIGEYLVENFDAVDLNKDGSISYVMFKGQEGNAEAIARTQYGVEDANKVLEEAGKSALTFYDSSNSNQYLVDQDGAWSAAAANNYMQTILSQYSEANNNMVELVIANNDEMAIGAVTALQNAGYNLEGGSSTVIPVFGVDATDAAKEAIGKNTMTGTIKQDADGMANTIAQISENYMSGADTFTDVDAENVVGTWRVNIPYATYIGEQ